MKTAPAFTLTELLVVLTILGLVAALVSAGAPGMFARARLSQAATRLAADLDLAAMRARSAGAFCRLESEGARYRVTASGEDLLTRDLPAGLRLAAGEARLDPAGRWSGGPIILESEHGQISFEIDPITGRVHASRHGADGSADRREHPRRGDARLSRHPARGAHRSRRRAQYGRSHSRGHERAQRGARELGERALFGKRAGFAWRLGCSVSREASSPRLALVGCTVSVARTGARPLTLDATWAAPREGILRRP